MTRCDEAESGDLAGDEDEPTDSERRWRERDERRAARERSRRYAPGPGTGETFYSPGMLGTCLHSAWTDGPD